jgi:sugar phosphate isomerase/epimerase
MVASGDKDISRLAIHQATTERQWELPAAIAGYARHGVHGITVRRDKLAACGMARARRLLAEHDMVVTGLSRAHLPTSAEGAPRQQGLDTFRRAIEEAAELGAAYLITLADGLPEGSKDIAAARGRARDGLAELLPEAAAAGVALGLEPLHPMNADFSCINRLGEANDMVAELASAAGGAAGRGAGRGADCGSGPGLGVLVDVYHVWWDPALEEEISRAGGTILGVHLSDWLVPTRDLMFDRGMMGDGVIDLARFCRLIDEAGFGGRHEVEIFSQADWWQRDPDEVVRTAVERYRTLC